MPLLLALLLGRFALGTQRPIVVKLSRGRSVGRSVRPSVGLPVCWSVQRIVEKRIRMPFGIVGRTGPGMRQMVGFGDRSTGRGTFGGEFEARHCNQWGLTFAATRPSSQITLGRLVSIIIMILGLLSLTCGFGSYYPMFTGDPDQCMV